jgi:hypothetical protein
MLDKGVWAEVKVGNEHLRLFAEHNAQGVQASVYNVISKTWIAPSEPVADLEQGKERAEIHRGNTSSEWRTWNYRPSSGRRHARLRMYGVTRMPGQTSLRKPFFCGGLG